MFSFPARVAPLCFFLLLSVFNLSAQNRKEYFKTIVPINGDIPEWVKLMYATDPNVHRVDFLYTQYFKQNPFVKNTDVRNYAYWRKAVDPLLNDAGFIRPTNPQIEKEQYRELKTKKQKSISENRNANWISLGPVETYDNGTTTPISLQANVYSIDQSTSNANLLIAGTESGGVFKTTDKGLNWSLISANEEFSRGIGAVKIHPSNPNIFLVAANRRIYQSLDGGNSWQESLFIDGNGYEFKFFPNRPDTIFCAASTGLFRSNNSGTSWTTVFTDQCWDLDFHPSDPTVLYLLKENTTLVRAELFRSDDSGNTWTLKDNNWYQSATPSDAIASGGKIGVTIAAPDRIYVGLIGQEKTGDNGWIGVYRSTNRGDSWTNPAGQNGSPYQPANTMPWNIAAYSDGYHQGFYNFDLEVSQNDADKLWVGTIRLSQSSDAAQTWTSIGAANSLRNVYQHADIQDIEVIGNDIWVASDGGIDYSNDELISSESRKKGVSAADFWGFGTGWNEDVLVGGKYHNGNSAYYQTYGIGNYMHAGGVEESTGYVNPLSPLTTYFGYGDKTDVRSIPDQLGGSYSNIGSLALRPTETYTQSYSSLLYFHPYYADRVFLGKGNSIYQSDNGGYAFENLYTFAVDDRVLEFEIARSNADVWYCVVQPGDYYWNYCELYKSVDAGHSWTQLPNIPGNRWRLEITVNPEDENDIWVASVNGANGQKVYQSTDGGTNWNARTSTSIDGESPNDLFFQGGTDDLVYLATDNSVFYWDGTNQEWIDYGQGLPLIINTLKLRPFYRDSKMRLATYGRGIWERELVETDFRPIAQPITYTDQLSCSRDTVPFDCYSILPHSGATWEWTFNPAPQYVSALNVRNPKVVFGANGTYSVSLKVTDILGQTHTRLIPDMVTVVSECELDSIPSMALKTTNTGDYGQIPDLGRTVDKLTITAWVKPDGIQPDYSGIVINDGTTAGFNFKNGDNSLAYHWPGGQWWWDSGLTVPSGEWSYVAMVATPTSMTLYVNGQSATQNIALDPVDLGTMKVGSYKAWSSRNFIGEIDEICFWDRALSKAEIRDLRHLTKDAYSDPNLFAYYQFNESSGKVLDKIGNKHILLNGNASRVNSSAPLGGGSSASVSVTAGGIYPFPGTGASLTFPNTGTYPNGDLVVSRINQMPYAEPNADPGLGSYWVINNYGTNANFTELTEVNFSPAAGAPNAEMINNPQNVFLYKRADNDFANDWINICSANTIDGAGQGTYTYSSDCNIGSFSQFYISSPLITLPVELLTFEARHIQGHQVTLMWTTAPEKDLAFYEVEHALDGRHFSSFNKKMPQHITSVANYQVVHHQAKAGNNYYRLKMVDLDGSVAYSPVRVVNIGFSQELILAPNPISSQDELALNNEQAYPIQFLLYNAQGKLMRHLFIAGNTSVQVELTDFPAGTYFYATESAAKLQQGKLVVLE